MQGTIISHGLIEIALAIFGLLLGLVQTLTLFILKDIRDRLVRLEDRAMGVIVP